MTTRRTVLERSVAREVRALRRDTGSDLVFGGTSMAGVERRTVLQAFDGNLGASLKGLQVETGHGLGGRALVMGRPVGVADYLRARSINHIYDQQVGPEQIRSVVAIPVTVDARPAGLIYLAARDVTDFGSRMIGRAVASARAIEREVQVAGAVERRLAEASTATSVGPAPRPGTLGALREIADDLRHLREVSGDDGVRRRLEEITNRLGLIVDGAAPPSRIAPTGSVTPRERQVLELLAVGGSNVQIADDLGLTEGTVKAYLKSASRKLGAHNRVHAVHLARHLGLVP